MKILTFADLHGSFRTLNELKEKAKETEAVVCAGDVSIFQERLDELLEELNSMKQPVIMVPGNHETHEDLKFASENFENIKYIHNDFYLMDKNYLFLGSGGGGFSTRDPEFEKISRDFKSLIKNEHKTILVTHAPPHNTKVDFINGNHAGSKSIREFLDSMKINLHVCGHLHENARVQDKVKDTIVVNPGYKGIIFDI
jgi:uncharacterized protein